ncbi:MAG: hypothetical protein ACXU8N_17790 [Telluria sp.]
MADQLIREEMQATIKVSDAVRDAHLARVEKMLETSLARMEVNMEKSVAQLHGSIAEVHKSIADLHKLYADAIKWIVVTIGVAVAVMGFMLQAWLAAHVAETRPLPPIIINVPERPAATPAASPPAKP